MITPSMYVTNVGFASVEGRRSFARKASVGDQTWLRSDFRSFTLLR